MTTNNKPAHTPSPWLIEQRNDDTRITSALLPTEKGWSAATLMSSDDLDQLEHDANIKLIAAAPLMAEALKWCLEHLDYLSTNSEGHDKARAALKAAGLNDENEGV